MSDRAARLAAIRDREDTHTWLEDRRFLLAEVDRLVEDGIKRYARWAETDCDQRAEIGHLRVQLSAAEEREARLVAEIRQVMSAYEDAAPFRKRLEQILDAPANAGDAT